MRHCLEVSLGTSLGASWTALVAVLVSSLCAASLAWLLATPGPIMNATVLA